MIIKFMILSISDLSIGLQDTDNSKLIQVHLRSNVSCSDPFELKNLVGLPDRLNESLHGSHKTNTAI